MAEQTTSSVVIAASPAAVMDVIADFPAYPSWAKGMKQVSVVRPGADGRAEQVHFVLDVSPIKDEYTLAYVWEGDRRVTWTLVQGGLLRALDGEYVVTDRGDGTSQVTYALSLDLTIPLIGMLKRKGERILIDTALQGLKTRVESLS
jgi:ribosome-associated toxin RatA of RatAB toxin-antitoxin module